MKKLILRYGLSPGDVLMLTAAVRDLHRSYPGQFLTDVRTSCSALWENNPYLTPLSEEDPGVEIVDCETPLINRSNALPYHYIHGHIAFLNQRLNLSIQPTAFRGDIHLSAQEKAWYSQVHELSELDIPFWIVAGGGKYDLTIKWWSSERYQRVVDAFRGRIAFVQIGAPGHFHPKLHGSIDLRGQTSLRELVRLVYHSQGVLCGVTALMHLAAAVETKPGFSRSRPCVVVAGGREPVHWEEYPGHQYIAMNGALPCCANGGCWRSRTTPLGDGDERDRPENLCVDVIGGLPRCMDMIGADEVARRIDLYFKGGVARYLTREEERAAEIAIKASGTNAFDETALTIHSARIALERFVSKIPQPTESFEGRGVVICGGGVKYFTNAWVCINMLRRVGCMLPIELWHLGSEEMDAEMRELVQPLDVICVDVHEVAKRFPVRRSGGWQSKPFAILYSRFREVIFLDADNVPVVNPIALFDTPQYRKTGAIFWPDFPSANESKIAWESCGLTWPGPIEFESGQIVVDKSRCWDALRLSLWFNEHSDFYYQHIHGDKETFHLAFHKLKQPYGFVQIPVKGLPGTMCQHDFSGNRIFQHRNMDKWNLFLLNRPVQDFWHEDECLQFVKALRERWDGRTSKFLSAKALEAPHVKRRGGPLIEAVMISCRERKSLRDQTLKSLSESDWGDRPIHVQIDESPSSSPEERQTETSLAALESFLVSPGTHMLFLEDDLAFNRHILHNLTSWEPIVSGDLVLGSLYNPGIRPLAWGAKGNFSLIRHTSCFGSQGFVISREAVKYIVDHWNEVAGKQDIKISRLAGRLQTVLFYHTPSLVQHIGIESSWGGIFHKARDFDPAWKAKNE